MTPAFDIMPLVGAQLSSVLDETHQIWSEGLDRAQFERYYLAQLGTHWGAVNLHRLALCQGTTVLSTAKRYALEASLDGVPVRVFGIGAVFTPEAKRGRGYASQLLERMLDDAALEGFDVALLFSEIGPEYYERLGFTPLSLMEQTIDVHIGRRGTPAMPTRSGDDRDIAAIAEMDAIRAEPFRFSLVRDADLVRHSLTKARLLAGLGPANLRHIGFFIAEEGASAVVYAIVTVTERPGGAPLWMIEACGDRDPSGARFGALLQALIARTPGEERPEIRGWLPEGFVPPQIDELSKSPTAPVMMWRSLRDDLRLPALAASDLIYWHGDAF